MIIVNGHEFRTLAEPIYINRKRVSRVFANGVQVYPELRIDSLTEFKVTLHWFNANDEDLHCEESNGEHIYFSHMRSSKTGGYLNHDIIHPGETDISEEHITWDDPSKMVPGDYSFYVLTYSFREGTNGFWGDVSMNGTTYNFSYSGPTYQNAITRICNLHMAESGAVKLDMYL